MRNEGLRAIILFVLTSIGCAFMCDASYGERLIVSNGDVLELSGIHTYDEVRVARGGVIRVKPYEGSAQSNTGYLEIIAETIQIDEGGTIDADGAGYRGVLGEDGEGPGGGLRAGPGVGLYSGASGGGNGEAGSAGSGPNASVRGGVVDGSVESWEAALGSAGGGYASYDFGGIGAGTYHNGGNGGGIVILRAPTTIIAGRISAEGADAAAGNRNGYVSAAGGGAGGGILIYADSVSGRGTLSAAGGAGAVDGNRIGGSGGGGRIVILYSKSFGMLNSQMAGTYAVYTSIYRDPAIFSTTHPMQNQWYADSNPQFSWDEASDFQILGFRYSLVTAESSISQATMRNAEFTAGNWVTYSNLDDGTYYLYVVQVLPDSSVTLPLNSFRVNIDTHGEAPTDPRSPTHPSASESYLARDGFIEWTEPRELSGVKEYLVAITPNLAAPASDDAYTAVTTPRYVFENFSDGTHYFHIRTRDMLDNVSEPVAFAVTIGPQPAPTPTPVPPGDILVSSPSHPDSSRWYANNYAEFSWVNQSSADILGYQYALVSTPRSMNTSYLSANGRFTTRETASFGGLEDGSYYFYVVIVHADLSLGELPQPYLALIDTSATPPDRLWSPTHPDQTVVYQQREGYILWSQALDLAGVDGYYFAMTEQMTAPTDVNAYTFLTEQRYVFSDLLPGYYFAYVRTRDVLGNISNPRSMTINIVSGQEIPTPMPTPTPTPIQPVANAGSDIQLDYLGDTARLDGSRSSGSGRTIEEYSWREDPDNPIRGLLPSYIEEPAVEVSPPLPGLYRFSLVIRTAELNSAPDSLLVRVPGIAGRVTVIGTDVPIPGITILDEPVSGAVVPGSTHTAVTNAQGEYALYGSKEGTVRLEAKQPLFSTFAQTLVVPSSGLDFDFSMTGPSYVFSGQVVDAANNPLDQVVVMVEPFSSLSTSTDLQGNFYFGDVPFGSRLVSFTKAGYGSTSIPIYFGRNVESLIIRLQAGFETSLYGRVVSARTGLPLEGIEVRWGDDRVDTTDAEGSYSLAGLRSGSNVLRAKGPGVHPLYETLEVHAGGSIHDIELEEPPVSLGGTVENGGMSVAGAIVTMEGGREVEAVTDATGYFLLPHVSLGRRTVVVTLPDGDSRKQELRVDKSKDVIIDFSAMDSGTGTAVEDWRLK